MGKREEQGGGLENIPTWGIVLSNIYLRTEQLYNTYHKTAINKKNTKQKNEPTKEGCGVVDLRSLPKWKSLSPLRRPKLCQAVN